MKSKKIILLAVSAVAIALVLASSGVLAKPKEVKVDLLGTSGVFVAGGWEVDGAKTIVADVLPQSFSLKAKRIDFRLSVPNPASGEYFVKFTVNGNELTTVKSSASSRSEVITGTLSVGIIGAKLESMIEKH